MNFYENKLYLEDVATVAALELPWGKLKDGSIVISGGSGLIGSFLVDVIMRKNMSDGLNCTVYAMGRNVQNAKERFGAYWQRDDFTFVSHDINEPLDLPVSDGTYVLHMASNVHPMAYSTDPIGTITANIIGTKNMLDFAVAHKATRFAFTSSSEIYGENRGDVEFFDEGYLGYLDCNTVRACYSEGKRCGEALCQAYMSQKGVDVVILRPTRSFGPSMLMSDTKAISQFIRKGIAGEDIVLKSAGNQYFSYTYVSDAVSGLLTALLCGESGAAYNIADEPGDIMMKDLAAAIAEEAGTKVVFELPDEVEKAGYSTATKARLDGTKLKALGWRMQYDISEGIKRTVRILCEQQQSSSVGNLEV